MGIAKLFINTVLKPLSFNDWQSLNSQVDMIVTGVAILFRVVSILSLGTAALILMSIILPLVSKQIRSIWAAR